MRETSLSPFDARLFVTIAELNGLTAAARKLGLQKSLVSRELAALEERLGLRLVQRTTRSISLTEAGQTLLAYAQRIVDELDHAEAALQSLKDAPRGELRITAPYAFLRHVIWPRLAEFQSRHAELRISFDPSTSVLDLVHEGIDLAIRIGELPSSTLAARRLASIPLVLVASPSYLSLLGAPMVPAELARCDLIGLGPRAGRRNWRLTSAGGKIAQVSVTSRISVTDPSLVLELAERGLGVAVVPLHYARRLLESGAIARVLPDHTLGDRAVNAVYPSRRLIPPKVRAFIDFASECLRE